MPYIITTKTVHRGHNAREPDLSVSRRAVATLEEAARAAIEELDSTALATVPAMPGSAHLAGIESAEWIKRHSPDAAAWDALRDECYRLYESGGTVGPLPDGTMIEVGRVDWTTLVQGLSDNTLAEIQRHGRADSAKLTRAQYAEIIDAFNAREAPA